MFAEYLELEPGYPSEAISKLSALGDQLCDVPDSEEQNIRRIQGMVAQSLFAAGMSQLGEDFDSTKPVPESAQRLFDQAFELAFITCREVPNRRLLPYISYSLQSK
jgi:hypothetical protein